MDTMFKDKVVHKCTWYHIGIDYCHEEGMGDDFGAEQDAGSLRSHWLTNQPDFPIWLWGLLTGGLSSGYKSTGMVEWSFDYET